MKRTPEEMLDALAHLFFDDEQINEMDADELNTELRAYGYDLSNAEAFATRIEKILKARRAEMAQDES